MQIFIKFFENLDNSSSLSPSVLKQICQIFNELSNPDNDTNNAQLLTSKLNELQLNDPHFHFYLLTILSNEEFSTREKLLSLIIIYRSYFSIDKSLIDTFIQNSIPIIEELLQCKISEISRFSAAIICSYMSKYGEDIIPNFFNNIFQMMQNPEFIEPALYTLEEISQRSIRIPKEILVILLNYVDSANSYHYDALSIFNNIVDDNINFIHQQLIPIILNSYESYEIYSLAKFSTIAAATYIHFPDAVIGDFIAYCLLINPPKEENDFNIIDDQLITTLYEKEDDIYAYHPLICAIITKLEEQDDDISNYGICSMAQSILISLFEKNPEIVGPTVLESISNIENNNGFLFRCLSVIISDQEASEEFIPIVLNEISNNGDFRGDAALCLSRYCEFNCESNEIIEKSLSSILPLLGETNDSNVRYQSIIAIQNLLDIINESFQPNIEHVEFLSNLMKTPELSSDLPVFAEFISIYMNFFPSFDEFLAENGENSFISTFFNEIFSFFLNENESNPLFISFANILSTILSKISNISNFDSVFSDIINKVLQVLNEDDIINDSNIDEKYSCVVLIEIILASYNQIEENKLEQILNFIVKVIKLQNEYPLLTQKSFELSLIFYQMNYQLIMSDELASFYLEACSNYLSTTNQVISFIVAQILAYLIPKMNFQQIQFFSKKCALFIRLYGDNSNPVFCLGHQLYHILVENRQEIDPFIEDSFHHSCDHCSCDDK